MDIFFVRNECGWRLSINNPRRASAALLEDNASAARDRNKALASAYRQALGSLRDECDDFGPVYWQLADAREGVFITQNHDSFSDNL